MIVFLPGWAQIAAEEAQATAGGDEPSSPATFDFNRWFSRLKHYAESIGSPLVIKVEDTEDSKPKDGRR